MASSRAEPLAYVKRARGARALSEAARELVAGLRDSAPRAANAYAPRSLQFVVSCDPLHGTAGTAGGRLAPKLIALPGGLSVVLTTVGYLLLLLCGLSVCLFCWLTYASLTGAARPHRPASDDRFAHHAGDLSARIIGAGSG